MDTSQEVGVGRHQRKRPPVERSLWETRRGSGPEGARFGGEGGARFGGLARKEPGSGAGMEPGSGVRRGGSPIRGRESSPVRGREWSPVWGSGPKGAQLGDRGAGWGGAQRLLGPRGQQAPLGLPGAHSPGRPAPAGQQGAAERGRTQQHPGIPARPLAGPAPLGATGRHRPAWSAPPRWAGGVDCRLGRPPSQAQPKRLCVCLLLIEEFSPEGLTKNAIT